MKIKVGSKWECISDIGICVSKIKDIVTIISYCDNRVYYSNGDFEGSLIVSEFVSKFKPLEFKLQEWDIVQCRNHTINIMTKENGLIRLFSRYDLSCVNQKLENNINSDTDIMKVWRLPDISIKKTLEEQIKDIEPIWIREEEQKTIYDLKDGDRYWCKTTDSLSNYAIWRNSRFDKSRLEVGNIFLTKEDCEFSIEEDRVRAIMRKYACTDKEWLKDEYVLKYSIFKSMNNEIDIDTVYALYTEFNYKTEEITQQVIDEIGEERLLKYYFKVK